MIINDTRSDQRNRAVNDERQRFLADVASFYFEDGMTQSEIGRLLGVSTAMVSRLLSQARQSGIVRISIQHPFELDVDLQAELVRRFSLRTARVAVVGDSDSIPVRLKQVGQVAAQLTRTLLKDDGIITAGWGTSIYEVVQAMPRTTKMGIRVVQNSGTLGGAASRIDNFHIVQALAERLNGRAYHLHAPMFVSSQEIRDTLLQEPSIAEIVSLARSADIMLVGLGIHKPEHSNLFKAGFLDAATLAEFEKEESVGTILGAHSFDVYGAPCAVELAQRFVGVTAEDARRAEHVILPALGSFKAAALVGALRTGIVTTLVTDNLTAKEVIQISEQFPARND